MSSPHGVRVFRSNRADRLARSLAEVLRLPSGSPLEPERVVISGRPAERWVSLHIAQSLGVAANVRFLSPTSFLEETLAAILGAESEGLGMWRAERLAWAVHELLPMHALEQERGAIAHYLKDETRPGGARAFRLAWKIGSIFERYASTRPDMVLDWDAGGGTPGDWQPRLWRSLRQRITGEHPAALVRRAIDVLSSGGARRPLPPRLNWYANGSIPPLHLELLRSLADQGVEVNLFALSASPAASRMLEARAREITGGERHPLLPAPIAMGHPLLESLDRQSRDLELLLATHDCAGGTRVDDYAEPAGSGVLQVLQRDLMDCRTRGAADRLPMPADGSVRVHACHGRLRQVEVLRDELLRCFDEIPALEPRDVVVLTPDIGSFAPLIDAVFSVAPAGEGAAPSIPFRIADRPMRQENPVADAMLHLLAMVGGRCDAAQVIELLSTPCIARRFELQRVDADRLQRWIGESGVRWGIDAAHRRELGLPAAYENTWRFGFDRLLVGQAMPGEERELFEGVLPYDEIEGGEAELLGYLAEACDNVFAALRDLSGPRSMEAWSVTLAGIPDRLLDVDDDTLAWPLQAWRSALFAMAEDARMGGNSTPLELAAVRSLLEERFDQSSSASGFAAGAVTFCAMLPGRAGSARVVALLGVDDGTFPRQRAAAGFDIAAREPRLGDPDPGTEDRQRFLEALMAAGDRLLITYCGRSVSTNEPVPPSVPVAELLDCVDATFTAERGHGTSGRASALLQHAHPLQPFNPACFREAADGEEPASYDVAYLAAAQRLLVERGATRPFIGAPLPVVGRGDETVVALDDLEAFFRAPVQVLLSRRMNLALRSGDGRIATREPAELDPLTRHGLRAGLLSRLVAGHDLSAALTTLRAGGALPHGAVGELTYQALRAEAMQIKDALDQAQTTEPVDPVSVDLSIGDFRIVGRLTGLHERGQIRLQPGAPRDRHLVSLWVRHLVLNAVHSGTEGYSALVALPADAGSKVSWLRPVDGAVQRLAELLELYREGTRVPLPFFPEVSRAFTKALLKHEGGAATWEDVLRSTRQKWVRRSGRVQVPLEGEDEYVRRAFGSIEPFADAHRPESRFRVAATSIWSPLERTLEQVPA